MGAVLVLANLILVPMLIRQRRSPGSLGRSAVLASVAGGIAVGSLGAWWLGFGGEASFEVPSSGDLYGDYVADPYQLIAQTGAAEEAGLVVETTGMRPATARLVPRDHYGPAVIDQLANVGDRVPVFVILQSKYNSQAPFFVGLRATIDGDIVDATPCSPDWDDAEPIGVDTSIVAALMCFDRVPDSPEVYVPTNLTERGVAVAADFG